MNVIRKLTLSSVKLNKKRSVATVIAIILSTALIVGTAGLCASALYSFAESARYQMGDFHVTVNDVPRTETDKITRNANVKSSFFTQTLGYALLPGGRNEKKPYLFIYAAGDEAFSGGYGIHLREGRLPENDTELLVSAHVTTNGGVTFVPGDTVTLAVGSRVSGDGEKLTQTVPFTGEESIENAVSRTFTVVGVCERPDWAFEEYTAPGYTCYTYVKDPSAADTVNVSYTLINARRYDASSEQILSALSSYGSVIDNRELLEYQGALSQSILRLIYTVGGIITLIIMGTSIFVIRNSFAISVAEKTKQYGILASVGATARQIGKSVLLEGLYYGAVGIPLGLLSGMGAVAVLLKVVTVILSDMVNGFRFYYRLPWFLALGAAALAGVTIFFSAWLPARRAGKIPPVEAVRQTGEICIRPKEVRVSGLTQRVFGMGGVIAAKNLKRSRKKYRTTVVSLVLSVTMFVSLASFIGYAKKSLHSKFHNTAYELSVYKSEGEDDVSVYDTVVSEFGLTDWTFYYSTSGYFDLETYGTTNVRRYVEETIRKQLRESADMTEAQLRQSYQKLPLELIAVSEPYFSRWLAGLGVEAPAENAAVLCDYSQYMNISAGDTVSFTAFNQFTGEETDFSFPVAAVAGEKYPMGAESYIGQWPVLAVSVDSFGKESAAASMCPSSLYIHTEDAESLEKNISESMFSDSRFAGLGVTNSASSAEETRRILLIAEIFLYGFITVITLIGVTNIFNTVTTNMNLRRREFAMLKSVGMTSREFSRMIRLESLMYGLKSLAIGLPLGVLGSIAFYFAFRGQFMLPYAFPCLSMLLSAGFVFAVVGLTMHYAMGKIKKDNIIETIRNENV